jgi:hypothetical protein
METDNKPACFDYKGLLLLKNLQDRLEYHFYNSKVPESIDINDKLESYYDSKEEINIQISTEYKIIINETGKLHKKKIAGVTTYYINDVDIELLLFGLTEEIVHIQIKRVNDVAIEEGDKKENEPRENKDKES